MTESYYGYATLEDGSLIAIDALNRENRRSFGRFFCFSCKRELIPALGEKVDIISNIKKIRTLKLNVILKHIYIRASMRLLGFLMTR